MKLIREEAYKEPETFQFDDGIKKRFKLDAEDQALLVSGATLFRGDTAFSLEEEDI